jgi:thymidylate synthase
VHDHWIAPEEGKWEYTYHERLFAYKVPGLPPVDQIAGAMKLLKDVPHTRRAQAVTWQAWNDIGIHDPACLQRMWFRIEEPEEGQGGRPKLNLAIHIRSNDAFKAAFMNMYAFTELQREMARDLGVDAGEYLHIADSFHIYGSYFGEFEGFLGLIARRPDRTFTTEFARPVFEDGVRRVLAEENLPADKRAVMERRLKELTA